MQDEMNMELDNIITLQDEDGQDVAFEFLDLVIYEDKEYVVLLPAEDDSGEVVILQLEEEDEDGESYAGVEDDDVLEAVFRIFTERHKEDFNFMDGEYACPFARCAKSAARSDRTALFCAAVYAFASRRINAWPCSRSCWSGCPLDSPPTSRKGPKVS